MHRPADYDEDDDMGGLPFTALDMWTACVRVIVKVVVAVALVAVILWACFSMVFAMTRHAEAHDAPTGWSYPYSCCSGIDCRRVENKAISERPEGYVISATGEVIPYTGDTRLRNSPDGEFHWCSVAGADDGRTICLFAPPRGM